VFLFKLELRLGSESSDFPTYYTLALVKRLFTALGLLFSGEIKIKDEPKALFGGYSDTMTKLELIQSKQLLIQRKNQTACNLDVRSSAATNALGNGSYCAALLATGYKAFLADLAWQWISPTPITDLSQDL